MSALSLNLIISFKNNDSMVSDFIFYNECLKFELHALIKKKVLKYVLVQMSIHNNTRLNKRWWNLCKLMLEIIIGGLGVRVEA